jgi:hypothetical protein
MRHWPLSRLVRALAVAVLATSAGLLALPGGTANADTSKVGMLQQAWFWQNAYEQANPPVAQSVPASEPSGVPDGDLAVAYTGNSDKSSSKLALLSFDVSNLTTGSSVSTFTFSLVVDGAPTATSFGTVGAPVVACLPTRGWPAELGGDYTNAPSVDCSRKVAADVNGSTYTFKVPAIAQTWVDDQNLGVAIVADPDSAAAPFQVVFSGAKDVKADVTYTPAVSGAGSSSGSTAGGGTVAVPAGSGDAGAGSGAGIPVPLPPTGAGVAPAPAPVVAPSPAAQPRLAPVAAAQTASVMPTKAFWATALALAAILLAASLVLGDPAPAAATATGSRLDRVLRARTVTEN